MEFYMRVTSDDIATAIMQGDLTLGEVLLATLMMHDSRTDALEHLDEAVGSTRSIVERSPWFDRVLTPSHVPAHQGEDQ
jgi:hypothetical protein